MNPVPVFSAVCDAEGVLHMDAIGLFRRYCQTLKNKRVRLTVKAEARPKSRNQLGFWWGVIIPIIAEHCGYAEYEHDAVHDAVIRELRGLRPEPNPLKLRQSMATMSHEEVSALIEEGRMWAMETLGVVIPDPDRVEAA